MRTPPPNAMQQPALNQHRLGRITSNRPISIDTLVTGLEDGADNPMFQELYNIADKYGFVKKGKSGLGTINMGDVEKLKGIADEPLTAARMSLLKLEYRKNKRLELDRLTAENPTDLDLAERRDQMITLYEQAVKDNEEIQNSLGY